MRLLFIGGTRFVGRHLVEAVLERGHEVTLFHRGETNPDLFPEVERVLGDRRTDLGKLEGRKFHNVIDTCAYHPPIVKKNVDELLGVADHYTFISTVSVYDERQPGGWSESDPLASVPEEEWSSDSHETYGARKAQCEEILREVFEERRLLVLRPGLIVGPHDPTDRFTYWPWRMAQGGEMLAPDPQARTQYVDARDLAEWTAEMVEIGMTGTYNVTGPEEPLPFQDLLMTCADVTGSSAMVKWASERFLSENDVSPFQDLPLWVPEDEAGPFRARNEAAVKMGLQFRPLEETVRDTWQWFQQQDRERPQAGLDLEREAALVAKL